MNKPSSKNQCLGQCAEIFDDLRQLAQSDGALHEISAIVYRDWAITVDLKEGRVADAPEIRWSTSKINKNELMLLLGLTVQSQNDRTYSVEVGADTFAASADKLLREMHDRLLADATLALGPEGTAQYLAGKGYVYVWGRTEYEDGFGEPEVRRKYRGNRTCRR